MTQWVKAEELVRDRWPDVLTAMGMDLSFFSGNNGPCPFCGGRDRFRWSKKHGGVFVCSQCTEGKYRNGFDLLMRHLNLRSFQEAADRIKEHFGVQRGETQHEVIQRLPQVTRRVIDPQQAMDRMAKAWGGAMPVQADDPVDRYLRRRVPGLQTIPMEVRCHPALDYWSVNSGSERPVLVGKFPAMLVRGFDAKGELVQLHKTYLTPEGFKADVPHPKKTDVGVGSNSFALRLGGPIDGELGVAEGIETALASSVLRGIPVWPCHSSSILANFELPQGLDVKRLTIFADSDEEKQGRRAGMVAAKTLYDRLRKSGVRILIMRPAKVGADFDDVLACS